MTARNEIERKLINNSRLLAEAQRIAQLGSWHWDQITGEISGSEEFYRIFGQHFNSYQGFIALVHPDDRELVNEKVQDTLDNQSPYDIYYRIIPPDGDFKIIHAQGKAIKDHAGTVVRMMGIAQNITERRNTEEALSEKRRELTELNRSLELRVTQAVEDLRQKDQMMILHERQALMGDMINNIAHQWRQPLNALGLIIQQLPLINEAGDLSRELLKEKTSKSIELIKHMSRTIEDFMNFFRSDKECITFSVNVLIAQTLSLIEQSFQDIGIKITTQVESDLFVVGYPNEFAQVLLNVLFNARYELINKNINSPLISLCAFTEGDKTVVTITDNAGGISEDIIERVFDPYFSTKGPDGGSGLGLYMSKTIIDKNMGGRISVRNIGGGAELRIEVTNGGN
jgi:PAS domain S-box-containing protein